MLPNGLAFFNLPGGMEWVIILIFGLLLFGRRMPDVARSLGKSIVEFKKGIREVRDDMEDQSKSDAGVNKNNP
jgi:sec-independent protein translocase protein TatA